MLDYILLGAIQGIFEWIPISSEGVSVLTGGFLRLRGNLVDLSLFLHLGTMLAVLIYFRKDWLKIITLKDKTLLKFLVIATIVSLAIGFPVYKAARAVQVGAGLLALTGLGLLFTAYFQAKKKKWNLSDNKLAVVTGVLQGFSVIPGFSRSGSTVFGLSLVKENPGEILRLSYLLSLPVVLAANGYLFLKSPGANISAWPALIAAFVVGFIFLHLLIKAAAKINFAKFALVFAVLCFLGAVVEFLI
ncbi:MAG: undecaprenyl-diphosphate phosphatase [Patescibacteria group bacterium]|nr:undecaprenyl-diphosphate phosphatase [Patescibacteria group bacterium]